MRLENKVILITGAGSGMGRAMAERFAAEGARVVVADLDEARVTEVVDVLTAAGAEAVGAVADVSKVADVDAMVEVALARFGKLDGLVNNAGIMDKMTAVADVSDELWRHVMAVNLDGPFYAIRRVIPLMTAQGGGTILNVASVGGLEGARAGAAYTASKHGLIGLTRNTAYMYAPQGIRCNVLCPGGVETNIGLGGEPSAFGLERVLLGTGNAGRIGRSDEMASVALMLMSDEASYVNGATLVADGGWTAY